MTHSRCILLALIVLLVAATGLKAEMHPDWKNSLKPKGKPGRELLLASGGKALYTIVLPAEPATQDQKAAEDLAMWLKEMTDADFPVVREGSGYQPTGKEISLGRTALCARAKIPDADADLGNEGYAIAQRGETLYLFGGKKRGPIYAVYALLEEDLGCRWYDSSKIHKKPSVDIPHRSELKFRPVPRHFVPVLEWRDPFYFDAVEVTWSLRNRTNSPHVAIPEEHGGHYNAAGMFVQTYNYLMPPDQYFGEHPEYFSELGGKRRAVQLCLTNPEVLQIMISRVKNILKNNPNAEFIHVSPNDVQIYCECEKCRAIDDAEGTKAGTLITFVNAVADAVKDDYPAVKVLTLAYLETFKAPKTVRPRDNVAIQLCFTHHWGRPFVLSSELPDVDESVKDWARIAETIHVWDYTSDLTHYAAVYPNFPVVTLDCRYYIENNARGIMLHGCNHAPGGDFAAMRCWVWAKQLWDPSLDTRELMRDFIYGYYGEAAEPVWQYRQRLWNKWEAWHKIPRESRPAHPMVPTTARYWAGERWISTDLFDEFFPLLEEAEGLADDPETKRRVSLAKLPLIYAQVVQGLYVRAWDYFSIGSRLEDALLGSSKDKADYGELIDEIEEIVSNEGMTTYGEMGENVLTGTRHWREMLEVTKHPRLFVKLNEWKFKTDPANAGLDQKWYSPDADDADWASMRSDLGLGWEKQGFADYAGVGWYRQRFRVPDEFSTPDDLFVLFFGVGGEADIYVNGEFAFLHKGMPWTNLSHDDIWASSFGYNIKKFLKPGEENVIALRVEHQKGVGGIWMPVYLVPSSVPGD